MLAAQMVVSMVAPLGILKAVEWAARSDSRLAVKVPLMAAMMAAKMVVQSEILKAVLSAVLLDQRKAVPSAV